MSHDEAEKEWADVTAMGTHGVRSQGKKEQQGEKGQRPLLTEVK